MTHRGIANGISISNVALINGMTTEVVIDNKTVDCLDFQVEAENLSLTRSDNNTFIDSTGEVSYRIITPSVIDANGKYLICDNSSLSFYSEGLYTFSVDFSDFFESNDNIEYPLRMTLSAVTETVTNKAFQAVNFYSDPDFSSSTDYMKLGYVGFNQGIICGRTQLKHVNFGTNFLLNNDCEIVEANINLYCTYKALMTGMSVQMRMLADNPSSFSDITYNT